ncbi:hypothetical protein PTSG_04437 [Salpingoeca rosetta]|uniref:PDZ domain-containing protein n=1 Tax=Salpingoeca rosetta (strain ATCC 50818 / BSB-021) TaxID=946362 RepID=F2U8K1_SALR5|nr:uncharacterized protein PTSG_04437 [Salpingoeca rosetta]EGD72709.1 hypothetical protein PTSG_04437 [Salpingoeca rosetta]|eukprot:XP_004994532.1 hypothetical protein PTSG_04437 [Salpingoeca rosetta]
MADGVETVECTVTPAAGKKLGMKLTGAGAPYIISSLSQDGVAAASGLCADDRVIRINDSDVSSSVPLAAVVKQISALHEPFTLTVRRGGRTTPSHRPAVKPKLAPTTTQPKPAAPAPAPKPAAKSAQAEIKSELNEVDKEAAEPHHPQLSTPETPAPASEARSEALDQPEPTETKPAEQPEPNATPQQEAPPQQMKEDAPTSAEEEAHEEHNDGGDDAVTAAAREVQGATLDSTPTEEEVDGAPKAASSSEAPAPSQPLVAVKAIGSYSTHGTRHGDVNQDVPFSFKGMLNGEPITVTAVFDGHGLLGEVAAETARKELDDMCASGSLNVALLQSDPATFMVDLFEQLNLAVLDAHDNPPSTYVYVSGSTPLSFELKQDASPDLGAMYVCPEHDYMPPRPIDFGCTAVVAVIHRDRLTIGNAGDADAIVMRQNCDADPSSRDGYLAVSHASKHTASSQLEIDRVDRDFPGAAIFTPDGYIAPTDPVLCQYELQLTRSLGHKLLRVAGIIATPDVHVEDLDPATTYGVVVCSDGVTDELQPFDMLDRVTNSAGDAADAAETLCKDAQEYCMDPDKIDDTTAVVVLLASSESSA